MASLEIPDTQLQHPFSCIIAGASQSGKTVLVSKLLRSLDLVVSPRIKEIIISYSEDQPIYHELAAGDSRVKLVKGSDFEITSGDHTLVCVDDQMNSCLNDKKIQDLFTKGVHHRSISVLLITQDLYPQEKFARTIRRNSTYMFVLRSPTFRSQISFLGRQIFPEAPKYLLNAYEKATTNVYSYLFINLHPTCPDMLRVSSGILPNEDHVVYVKET